MSSADRYMQHALALAERGWGQTAPNPMVGAVVVRDDEIVGQGFHQRYGEAHAEVEALRVAGERARGATVYVTLEPCAHHGKTPPCADALIAAGVRRVVIATLDPNPKAAGGAAKLRAAGVEIEIGVEENAARELNAIFLHAQTSPRAFVTLKLAVSLDGAIADASGNSRWITGDAARAEVHRLRAGHDAVAVGIGTALADDPSLTVRDAPAPRVPPTRIVFDRTLRLPVTSALARAARDVPTIVVTEIGADAERGAALEREGVTVLRAASLDEALRTLREREIRSVLVEGGPRIAGALLTSGLVDRLVIFRAPILLGAGALGAFAFAPAAEVPEAPRWHVVRQAMFGDDAMTVYAEPHAACSPESSTTSESSSA